MWVQCAGLFFGLGVGLQLLGAGLALAGVSLAYKRMGRTHAAVVRARDAARAAGRAGSRARARLRRLSHRLIGWPKGRRIELIATDGIEIADALDARLEVEYKPKRLDRQVDQLRKDLRDLKRHVEDTAHELKRGIGAEREARERGDEAARAYAADLLAGALKLEIYAAAAILLGVAAANLGPLLC